MAQNNLEFRREILRAKTPLNVLVESFKDGFYEGYDEFYNKIKIKSEQDLSKKWLKIDNYEVRERENFAQI